MGRKFGLSFSWKRASGISGFKNRVSRKTGIPLSRSGRQRKVGRAAGCFVATVSYGDFESVEVRFLRAFRDEILQHKWLGRLFICIYYKIGPLLASLVAQSEILKQLSRKCLNLLIRLIEKCTPLKVRDIDKNTMNFPQI